MSVKEGVGRAILAVARIDLGVSVREYVRLVEETAEHLSNRVTTLIASPPIKPLHEVLIGRRRYGSYRNNLNTLLNKLATLSRRRGITLILSPVLRRAGNKLYITNVIIPPVGLPIFTGREIVPIANGVSSGPEYEVLKMGDVNLCFSLLKDLEVPEVCRMCLFKRGDAIVVVNPPVITDRDPEMTLSLAMARARENRLPLIGVGGYAEAGSIQQPTYIIRSDGKLIEVSESPEPNIFEVEIPPTGKLYNLDLTRRYLKLIKEHLLMNFYLQPP